MAPKNLFSLSGKIAVLTGGNGFLGKEFAKKLRDSGARVIILDKTRSPKNDDFIQTDITDPGEVEIAVKKIIKKYGKIDILINNAALNPVPGSDTSRKQFLPYEKYPIELWEAEFKVGLTGALIMTQAVAPYMIKANKGSIINLSSIYGLVAPNNEIYEEGEFKSIAYAASKGAVLNFTRAWASRFAGTNIRVNVLVPGGVYNGQNKDFVKKYGAKTILGRMAEKEEIAGPLLFLASDASKYMTGATLVVDGGWSAW